MKFLLKTIGDNVKELYDNHGTFFAGDSGVDLFVVTDTVIPANSTVFVDHCVICQLKSFSFFNFFKKGTFYTYHSYLLLPRSSISKTPLRMANSIGLVDSGYLGTIKAALHNTSNEDYVIKKGERYVQLVRPDIGPAKLKIVEEHRETSRGNGGYGSTGR